jgi:DNA-binding NarL/FixJ family response regulator
VSIKILVVDDHGILRTGIDLIISQTDDMEVAGEAADGHKAIELARELKPDVVLMDISMPGLNGIDAARNIINENPSIKVIALSAYCERRFVKDMLKAGVLGYAMKDAMADELVHAIRVVNDGQRYLSEKVAQLIVEDYIQSTGTETFHSPLDKLSPRERELLQLIAENKSTKEAANLLHVSIKTIDARRRNIMDKLGVTGIADLTKIAIKEGLTTLGF